MKTVLPPRENTIEYPQFNIFIPYTDIQPATLISLIGYNYHPVRLEGDFGYSEFFRKRWEERQTFLSIEHDIVIYPGAIEAIWACPEELCTYDIHLPIHRKRILNSATGTVPPGLIKFSQSVLEKTQGLWDEPIKWDRCDQHLLKVFDYGITVHQHYPSVVNANEALLGFVNYEEDK